MRFEKYERPDLEELELELEGSFLDSASGTGGNEGEVGGEVDPTPNPGPWG
ncbi:MAG: hypothetical protein K2M05_03375 [Paramuribaculum sp.]|nr:hypothetical protein [Paramuribaculum sp.]